MAIFNSYVSLPEGILISHGPRWFTNIINWMIHVPRSQATPVRHGTNISIDDLQDTLISEEQFPLAVLQKEPEPGDTRDMAVARKSIDA